MVFGTRNLKSWVLGPSMTKALRETLKALAADQQKLAGTAKLQPVLSGPPRGRTKDCRGCIFKGSKYPIFGVSGVHGTWDQSP